MSVNKSKNTSTHFISEWLIELLLPTLVNNIKKEGHTNIFDYLKKVNHYNEFITCYKNISTSFSHNISSNFTASFSSFDCVANLKDLTKDLSNLLNVCNEIESNVVYFIWLFNLFKPLITTCFITLFLLPIFICVLLYGSSLFMFLAKHWSKLKKAYYSHDIREASFKSLAVFWETLGAIWHGHEIVGLENLPDSGPALLIYYHAAMPIDFYYVHSKTMLYKNRRMKVVADRFLFKVPGLASLLEAFEVTPGSQDTCVSLLNEGHILAISPGGVREALFSDHNYEIIWGNRLGFAKVATLAKCAVIPMFTENCREAMRTSSFFRGFFRYIYEKTRLPLVPIYGLFPVKLRTHIGKPIEFDESRTAEELKLLTKLKIEELIKKHQRIPGNIFYALLERFKRTKQD